MDPKVIIGIVIVLAIAAVGVWWCWYREKPAEQMTLWEIPRESPVIVPAPNSAPFGVSYK